MDRTVYSVCIDCHLYALNVAEPDDVGPEVVDAVDRLPLADGGYITSSTPEDAPGDEEVAKATRMYSWERCECCNRALGGERHALIIVNPETPC